MGQDVSGAPTNPEAIRAFSRALLRDVHALEKMLEEGLFETGIQRIGTEQEMFLVNPAWRPAPVALEVMEALDGPYTTELALFNLEANLPPLVLTGRCFQELDEQITGIVRDVRDAARGVSADVVLTGILPTLTKSDLSLDNITPTRALLRAQQSSNGDAGRRATTPPDRGVGRPND